MSIVNIAAFRTEQELNETKQNGGLSYRCDQIVVQMFLLSF